MFVFVAIYIALAAFVAMALLWIILRAIWRRDTIQNAKRATVEWIRSKWGAPEDGVDQNIGVTEKLKATIYVRAQILSAFTRIFIMHDLH